MIKTKNSIITIIFVMFSFAVSAHGLDVPIYQDVCSRRADLHLVHFSAYQPQFEEKSQYCLKIPKSGKTIVVIDLINKSSRVLPISFRIVEENTDSPNTPLLEIPAQMYPKGVIESVINFQNPGNYKAIVTIYDGDKELVSQWPILVNLDDSPLLIGKIFTILLLGFLCVMFIFPIIKSRIIKN